MRVNFFDLGCLTGVRQPERKSSKTSSGGSCGNFGDSGRFLLALGSVGEGLSNDKQRNVLNDQEGFQRSNLYKRVEGTWFCSSWTDYWQVLARPRIDLHPSQVVCNSRFMLWGC